MLAYFTIKHRNVAESEVSLLLSYKQFSIRKKGLWLVIDWPPISLTKKYNSRSPLYCIFCKKQCGMPSPSYALPLTSYTCSFITHLVVAARKRSDQWCVSLTPNNTATIGRMTCHCFLCKPWLIVEYCSKRLFQ